MGNTNKKESLYTGTHDLGNGPYQIEIFLSYRGDLVITAQHTHLSDSFVIEISDQKVSNLVSEFSNNYAEMAMHLKIMNKRMVLLNPKYAAGVGQNREGGSKSEMQENKGSVSGVEL